MGSQGLLLLINFWSWLQNIGWSRPPNVDEIEIFDKVNHAGNKSYSFYFYVLRPCHLHKKIDAINIRLPWAPKIAMFEVPWPPILISNLFQKGIFSTYLATSFLHLGCFGLDLSMWKTKYLGFYIFNVAMCRNVHPTVYYSLIIEKHLKQNQVSYNAYIFICVSLCNQTSTFVVGFALTVLANTYKLKGTFFFQQVKLITICHCQSNVICLCSQISTTAILGWVLVALTWPVKTITWYRCLWEIMKASITNYKLTL